MRVMSTDQLSRGRPLGPVGIVGLGFVGKPEDLAGCPVVSCGMTGRVAGRAHG